MTSPSLRGRGRTVIWHAVTDGYQCVDGGLGGSGVPWHIPLAGLVAGGNAALNCDVIVELIAQFDRIGGD